MRREDAQMSDGKRRWGSEHESGLTRKVAVGSLKIQTRVSSSDDTMYVCMHACMYVCVCVRTQGAWEVSAG